MGEPSCEQFFCINEYISTAFVIESLSASCFYPSISIVFVHSFSHLPISSVGCSFFKSLGMAHRARLLVTVSHGGVRSVRSKNKSYIGQSKEKECASVHGRSCLPCDNKQESKMRGSIQYCTLMEPPSDPS